MDRLDYYSTVGMGDLYGGKFAKGQPMDYNVYRKIWKSKHNGSVKGASAAYRKLHGEPKKARKRTTTTRAKRTTTRSSAQVEKLKEELLACQQEINDLMNENVHLRELHENLKARYSV